MKSLWLSFAVIGAFGFAFSILSPEARQEVAKYISLCFVIAVIIRPVGLTIGNFLRKIIKD